MTNTFRCKWHTPLSASRESCLFKISSSSHTQHIDHESSLPQTPGTNLKEMHSSSDGTSHHPGRASAVYKIGWHQPHQKMPSKLKTPFHLQMASQKRTQGLCPNREASHESIRMDMTAVPLGKRQTHSRIIGKCHLTRLQTFISAENQMEFREMTMSISYKQKDDRGAWQANGSKIV